MRTLAPNEKAKLDFGLLGPRCSWENCSKRKQKSESYSLVDSRIGVYQGLGAIIQEEGGR